MSKAFVVKNEKNSSLSRFRSTLIFFTDALLHAAMRLLRLNFSGKLCIEAC